MQKPKPDPFNRQKLRLLIELLQTRHLGNTAERLGMSAASASRKLDALREAFGDPLFITSGRGLMPTPLMLSLEADLRKADQTLENLLSPRAFDPAAAEITFRIAVRGLIESSLIPYLLERLQAEAPHCRLEHTCRAHDSFSLLLSGDLDFVVSPDANVPPMCRHMPVMPVELGVMVRNDHPLVREFGGGAPTLEALKRYPRIATRLSQFGEVRTFDPEVFGDDSTKLLGITNEPLAALVLAAQTDFIVVAPRLGISASKSAGVTCLPLPEGLRRPSGRQIVLAWTEEHHQDPANIWMRSLIRDWSRVFGA